MRIAKVSGQVPPPCEGLHEPIIPVAVNEAELSDVLLAHGDEDSSVGLKTVECAFLLMHDWQGLYQTGDAILLEGCGRTCCCLGFNFNFESAPALPKILRSRC